MSETVISQIAPTEVLRVGINLGNILLVTDRGPDGTPIGVAPDLARAVAESLGVPLRLIPFPKVGQVADAICGPEVDIGLIAWEPERAESIAFSDPYVEIEATYLVAPDAPFETIDEIDQPGVKIAVADRAAYDLYLKRSLKYAELCRAPGLEGALEFFRSANLPVLAGLRPALQENAAQLAGTRVLPGQFTSIKQAIGMKPGLSHSRTFINAFIAGAKRDGLIGELLARHGVSESLTIAA